jgi:hypothetical protein
MLDFNDMVTEEASGELSLKELVPDMTVCVLCDPGLDEMPFPDDFPLEGDSNPESESTEPPSTEEN